MYKHIYATVCLLCLGVLLLLPQTAFMQGKTTSEVITSFYSVIEIQEDGSARVSELITYDFGDRERHGIYRDIPLLYEYLGDKYVLGVENITVTSPTGASATVSEEHGSAELSLRIGDPDRTVTGTHQYDLNYTVTNVLGEKEGALELYWNATGNDWEVPIELAEVTVFLPEGVAPADMEAACYQGGEGSEDTCDLNEVIDGVPAHVTFTSENLSPGEGLTVATSFPASAVSSDYEQEPYQSGLLLMLAIGFVAVAGLGSFFYWFWAKYGKDPKGRGVIVRQYDPPKGLTPAEVGVVVDERIHDRDITAELVYLAQKGYLHILAIPKQFLFFGKKVSYIIFKLKEPDSSLKEHEHLILKRLFKDKYDRDPKTLFDELPQDVDIDKEVLTRLSRESIEFVMLKDLEKSFHKDLKDVKKTLYTTLTEKEYFVKNPHEIIGVFTSASAVFFIVLWILGSNGMGFLMFATLVLYAVASAYVLSLIKRTEKGVAAKEYSLGLRQYLTMAEKERMEFHFDPRKNPKLFEKLLPYAIALKVDRRWAEQFEGMYQEEPSWYTSSQAGAFSSTGFISDLSGFSKAASQASSSSASGGGGFSGGGAGGGGGGSW